MTKRGVISFLSFFLVFNLGLQAQNDFTFFGKDKDEVKVDFKLVNNLIVFPLEINKKKLHFILDTGVNKSILFSIHDTDSLDLNDANKVFLKGLGSGAPVNAIRSRNNVFKIESLISRGEELYVVTENKFSLSSKMGLTIHGIIGYNLIKDVILKIDYSRRQLTFYNPKTYKPRKCRKCETYPIVLHNNKPYIDATIHLNDSINNKKVKLLIDSGGSDALWLFEEPEDDIITPDLFFHDVLGEGLSGVILGKRSRIKGVSIGKYEFEQPTVSFLDSVSTISAKSYKKRKGSIGAYILRRFTVWLDYTNKQITLKKNSYFKKSFEYNMSGMSVSYYGKELVKVEEKNNGGIVYLGNVNQEMNNGHTISFVKNYKYVFKPIYEVDYVLPKSPAGLAGVKSGDLLYKINGKMAYEYTLIEIHNLLQRKAGKRISLVVKRNGEQVKIKFELKRII